MCDPFINDYTIWKRFSQGYFIVVFQPKVLQRKILEFKLSIGKAVGVGWLCGGFFWDIGGSLVALWGVLGALPERAAGTLPQTL
jgi:hypothetical protein